MPSVMRVRNWFLLRLRQGGRVLFFRATRSRGAWLELLFALIVFCFIVQLVMLLGDDELQRVESFTKISPSQGSGAPMVSQLGTPPPSAHETLPATTAAVEGIVELPLSRHGGALASKENGGFSLDEADAAMPRWTAATVDGDAAVPAAVRRAVRGEAHAVQREMLPYVTDMLDHALHAYFTHAFPHDDLLSLTGGHGDSFGGVGVTLLDSLDTLALAGRQRTFRRAARWVETHAALATRDFATSAFEVNIRAVGGLLAAHYMYEEGVVPVVRDEHDYAGGLLRIARDLGERLMRVFDSPTGLPFQLINLQRGEVRVDRMTTANADAGTFLLELTALSRLTGNATYGGAARRAAQILHDIREPATQLMNMHLDLVSAKWKSPRRTSIGVCIDSTIEYAVKHHVLSGEVQEWREYEADRRAASAWLRQGGFYYSLLQTATLEMEAVTQSLSAFYPGNLVLSGHHREAVEGLWAVHGLLKRTGTLAEETELRLGYTLQPQYHLRPEHVESLYYLYRATHDPVYLVMGREFAVGLQLYTRVPYGFAILSDNDPEYSRSHLVDYMESFLIAETLKYLYLLFDEASAVHSGRMGGGAVGWVFTTEAHMVPNTWEQWGLDAASVRTGLREAPVKPAYTAYMFNRPASRLPEGKASLRAAEDALAAEAAVVRDRWLFFTQLHTGHSNRSSNYTVEQFRGDILRTWEIASEQTGHLQRAAYRQRVSQFTESVAAARGRHVRGLLCAVHRRLRRVRDGARAQRSLMRELRSVCAASGPTLDSPLYELPSAPFTQAAKMNAVHRHYSDGVNGGAYEYQCEIAHLRGVRHLSRGVYHPAVPLEAY